MSEKRQTFESVRDPQDQRGILTLTTHSVRLRFSEILTRCNLTSCPLGEVEGDVPFPQRCMQVVRDVRGRWEEAEHRQLHSVSWNSNNESLQPASWLPIIPPRRSKNIFWLRFLAGSAHHQLHVLIHTLLWFMSSCLYVFLQTAALDSICCCASPEAPRLWARSTLRVGFSG